jgi:hypothetical protein
MGPMFGAAAAYFVALSAMLFAVLSALTLAYTVRHLDPPEAASLPKSANEEDAA